MKPFYLLGCSLLALACSAGTGNSDGSGASGSGSSSNSGNNGTPVWSPRGDLIAFTKQQGGRFTVGVMRTDGQGERLLSSGYHDEGPTWAPNGRVLMFTREGQGGAPAQIWSVDISGRNERRVQTPGSASGQRTISAEHMRLPAIGRSHDRVQSISGFPITPAAGFSRRDS